MFKETVDVIGSSGNKVEIKFNKRKMCSCCRMYQVCGKGEGVLTLENTGLSLEEGDRIQIGIDEKMTILANILLFLVPAMIFIAALAAGRSIGEVSSFFIAMGAVCLYYILAKIILKKQGKKFKVEILQKL